MRRVFAVLAAGFAFAGIGSAAAIAAPNPSGTGQPNQTCQGPAPAISPTNAFAPGHASSSPGSVFNEPIVNTPNGGKGGQQYNLVGAPSQYDVACFQQASKP